MLILKPLCLSICSYSIMATKFKVSVDAYKIERWLCLLTTLGIMSKSCQILADRQVFKTQLLNRKKLFD